MNKIIFFVYLIIFLLCTCDKQNSISQIPQIIYLEKQDSVTIPDKEIYFTCITHYSKEPNDYLYGYNFKSNSFYKYSFPRCELLSKINIPSQLGTVKDFSIIKEGTIILQPQKNLSYYLINEKGQIKDTLKINLKKYLPLPCVSNINPVFANMNNLFITGYSGGVYKEEKKGDRSILVSYNLNDDNLIFYGDYPEVYYTSNFGGLNYRRVYNAVNYDENIIVFSFPASHDVHLFDIKNKKSYIKHISQPETLKIEPFSRKREWYGSLATQDYVEYYYTNNSYAEIYYDKYKHVYYRIFELPNSNFNFHKRDTYYKEKLVIVYDKNFKILGYAKIPDKIYTHTAIITKEGLYFQSKEKSINKWYLYNPREKILTSG